MGRLSSRRFSKTSQFGPLVDRESNNPAVLDEEHIHLRNGLAQLYSFLRFHQGVEISGSKEPDLLCGSHLQGEPMIRQMTKMAMFYESKGYRRAPVTKERLEEALQLRSGLHAMQKTDEFQRIFRGIDVLFDGLKATGQNRLHQFVRSLEALILPDTGKTRKQFIHRCQTFASPGAATEAILREAFDMRSDAEHLHSWERAVMSYPKTERDDVCWQRTRQMQFLACDAYTKILLHPDIGNYFRTEQTLENFWKLGDQGTRSIWGKPVDLAREVRHSMYDQFGRPISAD
ncbi:hypothetical protein EDE15_2279 [Edaphobacter aggregans]|uniref:Uncharacterized protein n=1 Tax=Edaphobacter aggregans TaxID=570835 RepID=A0A3R9R306_9BACT|nr:hypothetical protein [Edaphobacter aggregans]RSL16756.1 hypothetical protein EDE15_2279 [Edaphobacter aggregans]